MPSPLDIAREAALAGGAVLHERAGHVGAVRTKSSASDLVTEVDIASGVAVARAIAAHRPRARFVIEEPEVYERAGVDEGALSDAEVWVVDPLDGTTSYVHGFPAYSVSVALLRDGRPVAVAGGVASRATRGSRWSRERRSAPGLGALRVPRRCGRAT